MGRDPAFLWYDGDAARDVSHMNRLERGCYFDLIQAQRKTGRMSLEFIKKVLGHDFDQCWESVNICLTYVDHMYFIEWVENSIKKREKYCESRKLNKSGSKDRKLNNQDEHMMNICETYDEHMENENENRNEIKNLWVLFKNYYPQNGSTLDPAVEKEFIKLIGSGIDPQQIIKAAKEYAEYWKALESGYPYGKFIAQAINWLEKKQFAVDWVKKLKADQNQKSNKNSGRIINEYERSAAEKYKNL